ncbi:eIF-2-alpha kinase GCN2-like isoform X2 [Rhodnius prolixus]|uniref:eIF-2-alpha kinase GCN2-like isoform X2 n=1 Tax=Rhodnius prolixus TaxID=13249 RepID=UPI003D1882D9
MEEDSCQDRQENEKAALMAIYGDQMKLLYDKSDMNLWKPLECILRLWPPSSQGPQKMDGPSVDLHICCPHDYPNVLPTIELEHPKKISFGDTISLRNELVQLANLLKGEVMIFELAQHVEYESFYEEMMYRNQELKESERLKRQAAEEKKLKDIKLKIRSEQQAVRKALRKKHSGAELTHLENLPAERREQAARKQYVPSKVGQGKVVTSNITEEFVPWNFPNGNLSRFKNEFEHIYWLGKGAFGDVIKVRNKLDDGFYAVKRIELNPCKIQLNKKITREVKLLSRLNHENVVRYYNSWIEMAAMEDTKSTDDSEFERNRKNRAKSPTEKLLSLQNKRDWTIDKASECTSDDSSSDTWIAFRSGSKSPMQSSMSALPKSNTNEPSVLPQTPQKTSLHMYIQMELCEKSTLRIAIDEGLFVEVERVWRLFREVVEGLCHIHQQGIIHRDLKPVNIFIDHDDHVKIGDFGLATTIIRQRHTAVGVPDNLDVTNNSGTPSSQLGKDISHTGQVGTAFYVAPELSHTNRKTQYNQKVDTYSLGIIFFEMCHPPVATSMERCKIMKDIRQVNPVFPSDFPHSPSSHQAHLIRWMLDHDVKSRPSSQEVLQCDIVPPPQLEEAEVKEMVRRTLSNPQSKDYKFLIASCFNQQMPPTLDATFNVSSWRSNWFVSLAESVSEILRRIMRGHGAISFLPPLLTPAKDPPESSVSLMTRLGSIVYATFDIRTPFVRFLKHNPSVCHMKRYAIDKIYRERPAGVHPKEVYECAFDIVTSNSGDLMPEFELIATTWEVLCEFPTVLKKNTVIRLNHSNLVLAILNYGGLDQEKCEAIAAELFKTKHSELEARWDIEAKLRSYGVAENIVTSIINLISIEGTLREVSSQLEPLTSISGVFPALQQLETLINYCQTLEITCPMIVSLRLIQNSHNYSGIMFQVTYDQLSKQKQVEHVLISGGRYDRLLRDLNAIILPEEVKLDQYVAGFILSIDKLVTSFNDSEKPNSADILLCSMGSIRMTPDRLHLIRDLWKSGLKTVYFNSVETMEEIQTYCQEMGILFVVILKETEPGFARVRSLAADRFSDKKIPYSELMEYIRRMKNKSNNDLGTISSMVKVRDSPLITFILTEKLNPGAKRRYENQVMNVISPALQRLSSSVKIEVLVIAIENEAFLFLSLCLDMSAGNLEINNFVKRYPRHKKYVQKIMNHFEESKKSPKPPVLILYSLQENIYKVLL